MGGKHQRTDEEEHQLIHHPPVTGSEIENHKGYIHMSVNMMHTMTQDSLFPWKRPRTIKQDMDMDGLNGDSSKSMIEACMDSPMEIFTGIKVLSMQVQNINSFAVSSLSTILQQLNVQCPVVLSGTYNSSIPFLGTVSTATEMTRTMMQVQFSTQVEEAIELAITQARDHGLGILILDHEQQFRYMYHHVANHHQEMMEGYMYQPLTQEQYAQIVARLVRETGYPIMVLLLNAPAGVIHYVQDVMMHMQCPLAYVRSAQDVGCMIMLAVTRRMATFVELPRCGVLVE
eukprot:CAMPEP_0184692344 /NCGR_PEP_ID=MMETSP0313-20130426/866_1 /TAXON_ID=2792 /ORGANISM="Porphyridium aerugineum, Strain SAG 1380-2" /LENGTH=286 /DNA_ID=CAMNT_0027150169 /DNA_START=148 /DNA_END=1008 /DNA_ORIENTATION=+